MKILLKLKNGKILEKVIAPNSGNYYTKKDFKNAQTWVAKLNREDDVKSCKLEVSNDSASI